MAGSKPTMIPSGVIEKMLEDRHLYNLSFNQMAAALFSLHGIKITGSGLRLWLKREGLLLDNPVK